MKRRHEFYLDEDISDQLAKLAGRPGASKTAIMSAALRAYLDRRATNELDDRFRIRLDRLSNQTAQIARDQQIVAESVAALMRAYIRNALALDDTRDRDGERQVNRQFERFLAVVSQNVSNGHSFIDDVLAAAQQTEARQ